MATKEPFLIDPPCPACGVVHERTRVGNSMTFIVESKPKPTCGYRGPIPWRTK